MLCSYWPMKVSSSSCWPLLLMCGYRYISELEQSDPAFHSPVQYWFVQHLCEFSSCTSYESVCRFLLDKICHKASTNWLTYACWQTPVHSQPVLMALFLLMPYAKCALFKFHDLNCTSFSSIEWKLKQFFARIAWYIVHVGWHALFLLYYFRRLCQSIKTSLWSCTCKVCRKL